MSRNTLSDKKEIARVFRHGKRRRGSFFTLIVRQNTRETGLYVVSIAKKNLQHAADRNLVRRRTQNFLKKIFLRDHLQNDWVVQFNAKEMKKYQEIESDLTKLFSNFK